MPPTRRRRIRRPRRRKTNYARKNYQVTRSRAFMNYPFVSSPFGPPTFPKKLNQIFRWTETGNGLVSASTSPTVPQGATLNLAVNSLHDPGISVFSKQPRWLDTLLGVSGSDAVYSRYYVSAFAIEIEAYNATTTNFVNHMSITLRTQDSSAPGSLDECYSRADTKVVPISPPGSGAGVSKISHYGTTKNIFSVASPAAQDQFKSLYNTSPVKIVYADVTFWNADNTQSNQMYYTVHLKQYATLYSLNDPVDS